MSSLKEFINYMGKIERNFSHLTLYLLLRFFGPNAAQKYFIHSPLVRHTRARILWLHEQIISRFGQEAANSFVVNYLSAKPRALDYGITLIATGVRRPDIDTLSKSMPAISARAKKNKNTSIALVSALLERGDIEMALKVLTEYGENKEAASLVDWTAIIRSLTPRPLYETTSHAESHSADYMKPQACKSRLIVMDGKLSPAAIRTLTLGAEKVTLLQYGDLYGKIDLEAIRAVLPGVEIEIEHGRSRIDRFQQQYFDVHQKTLKVAETLMKSFIEGAPWIEKFVPGISDLDRDLVLEVSDKLFFKALRIEAIHRAVLDPSFDSVIVSFGESFELFRFFFSGPELWQNPRIKGCCRTESVKTATKFASRIADMQRRAIVGSQDPILGKIAALEEVFAGRAGPSTKAVEAYLTSSAVPKKRKAVDRSTDRKSIAFVAHESRAYIGTSAQMATHLSDRFDVDILAPQGNPANLQKTVRQVQKDAPLHGMSKGGNAILLSVAAKEPGKAVAKEFSNFFLLAVADTARKLLETHKTDLCLRSVLDSMLTEGLPEAVLHVLGNACTITAHLKENDYSAIVVSPIRSPRTTQFATIARAIGIPSIAIEPHCINAAYCRYGTVPTDYAAVYSDYFATEYDRYFGIPRARCYTFGSPRIMRPVGYSPLNSRKEARKRIGLHAGDPPIISFPTQPMPADHILPVWRMIIRGVKAIDMPARIILKAHPEEGPGHVDRYRQIIAEENAGHICYVADIDIKDLLIASDVVLNCYSVTALEAAILERNVAIVSTDGVDYPMPWHDILGVPFCTNSDQITKVVSEALTAGPESPTWVDEFVRNNPELIDNSTFDRLTAIVDDVIAKGPETIRRSDELASSLFVTAPFREYLA